MGYAVQLVAFMCCVAESVFCGQGRAEGRAGLKAGLMTHLLESRFMDPATKQAMHTMRTMRTGLLSCGRS